jgi:DNA mismatch repair protein MutS2
LKLEEIPGVGSRTRDRLLGHFGSEELAIEAISRGDIAGLARATSERQALSLVQWAQAAQYGVEPDQFLATEEARHICEELKRKLASYTHTEYARLRVSTLFPASCQELIDENRRLSKVAMDYVLRLEGQDTRTLLGKIKFLKEGSRGRIRGRAIAVASPETFQELKSRGLDKLIDLSIAESSRALSLLAESYAQVTLVGEGDDLPGVEEALSLEEWYLVPESILGFFQENLETIISALALAEMLQNAGISQFSAYEELQKLLCRMGKEDDLEQQRLERLLAGLGSSVNEATSWANAELKKRIEASSLTLEGADLLSAVSRGEGVKELLEMQMRGLFAEVAKEGRSRAASELQLADRERVWLEEIIPSEIRYPLEIDRRALYSAEQHLRREIEARHLKVKRELARGLEGRREAVHSLVRDMMEFDFLHALGKFAMEENLMLPELSSEPCLGFHEGRNLFLQQPEPVSYSLGRAGMAEPSERVALLSGVNSGGKTCLLDLVAQICILGHMGLPVPASMCRMSIFQKLYYFSKSRGTLSAGAFEAAMRKFAVLESPERKLVLADELESITEPGASARIIACMLDELNALGSAAVFVSHLAEDVLRFCETAVRVDGIEASGLDEKSNLIVLRTPRYNYLARSTPELILDRLVRTARAGREREFYAKLLAKFR